VVFHSETQEIEQMKLKILFITTAWIMMPITHSFGATGLEICNTASYPYLCLCGQFLSEYTCDKPSLCTTSQSSCTPQACECTKKQQECPEECPSTSWGAHDTGYQKRCNTNTYQCEYRCAAGYYGSSTDGTSGCESCPTYLASSGISLKPSVHNGSSIAGATQKNQCYIPTNTKFNETKGSGIYSDNCYYKDS